MTVTPQAVQVEYSIVEDSDTMRTMFFYADDTVLGDELVDLAEQAIDIVLGTARNYYDANGYNIIRRTPLITVARKPLVEEPAPPEE